jgi:hypothetical protein
MGKVLGHTFKIGALNEQRSTDCRPAARHAARDGAPERHRQGGQIGLQAQMEVARSYR